MTSFFFCVHWSVSLQILNQDLGRCFPAKNDLKSVKALCGWINGTSCPAPLTVAKVSPS